MKKKTKKLIYTILAVFLLAMAVMTVVSRVMNESHIPEVETQTPRSSTLVLEAVGQGVVCFGTSSDARLENPVFSKDTYYVEGYFFEKEYLENVTEGSEVCLDIEGKTVKGILKAKMYNYREDTIDVIISLPEGKTYKAGKAVEFVLENVKVRYPCCISRDLIYVENGSYYIYLLQERDSILGNITIAVKKQIHIVAQNERAAAIEEEFGSDIQIITKGTVLEDGMRVKKKEW